jgi:anti-anti-sigma factor
VSATPEPRIEHRDSIGIVRLDGDVDVIQSQDLRDRLLAAVRNEDLGLIVDLTDARYIDSVGVSLLFELAERLSARQLRLAVVLPADGLVERVLRIVNLASVAAVRQSVPEALTAVREGEA